jgi:hypothetical protein
MPPDFSQIGPFLFAALVVFAIYRRFRRNFGRQLLRPGRMTLRIVLLAVLGCALLPLALRSAQYLWAEIAGAALGIGLGLWGAERTRFMMYGDGCTTCRIPIRASPYRYCFWADWRSAWLR